MRSMNRMRKLLSVLLALLMIASVGLVPAAYATDEPAQEESLTWTKTAETLFSGTTYDLADICQFVLSPLDRSIPYTDFAALDASIAAKDLTRSDMTALLSDAVGSIGRDLSKMTVSGLLALPESKLDEVKTYLYAGLKAKGVVVDKALESESGKTAVYWVIRVYDTDSLVTMSCYPASAAVVDNGTQTLRTGDIAQAVTLTLKVNDPKSAAQPISFEAQIVDGNGAQNEILAWTKTTESLVSGLTYKLTDVFDFALLPYDSALPTGRLSTLTDRIADKNLDSDDMQALMTQAMITCGVDQLSSGQQILKLNESTRKSLAARILGGLKALGVEVTAAQEAETAQTILYWFVRTFDPDRLVDVRLSCGADVAEYKSAYQTIVVKPTESDKTFTLTLSARDNANVSVSFVVRVKGAFDPRTRSLTWKGAKRTVLVTGTTYKLADIYSFVLSPFDHSCPYGELSEVDKKIAGKKLDKAFMVSLLSSAMTQIDRDLNEMDGSDVMMLSEEEQNRAANYIFVYLKNAGVDVNVNYTAYTKEARTVLYWMLRVYDAGRLVTLTTDVKDTIDIDNEAQTLRVLPVPIVKENEIARLTLCANDPDPACTPITMDVAIEEPLTISHDSLSLVYKSESRPVLTASKEVTWASSDERIVTVDKDGVVTPVRKGSAVITATREVSGEQLTCNVTVRYTFWQWLMIIFLFGWIWYI